MLCKKKRLSGKRRREILAERAGFEPAVPFWSTHTFQACPFNHSGTSPFINYKDNVKYIKSLTVQKLQRNIEKQNLVIKKTALGLKNLAIRVYCVICG